VPLNQPPASSAKPYHDPTGANLADYPQPSVAVNTAVLTSPRTQPGPRSSPTLPYDHAALVKAAANELPRRYADRPDPERILGPRFTIRELRDIHEAIPGTTLQEDTFRRATEPHLQGTGTLSPGIALGRMPRSCSEACRASPVSAFLLPALLRTATSRSRALGLEVTFQFL
jgi:hypothetical protein